MHARHLHSPFARDPAAMAAPLFAKLEIRSAESVLGWSDRTSAEWCLARDIGNLTAAEKNFKAACVQLGQANRSRVMRRQRKAAAFRLINQRRGQLIRARKALAASQAVMATFAEARA